MNFARVSGGFVKGDNLPGDVFGLLRHLPAAPLIPKSQLYLGLQDFIKMPAYTNPNFEVTEKPNCEPALINCDKLHGIGDQEWKRTYTSQPVVASLLRATTEGPPISLVSQPIAAIRNETDVNALYCYIEAWAVGLLRSLNLPVTGSREVKREQDIELQPKAPEDNDLLLRLDGTLTWSDGLYINFPWVGTELKFYGMNAGGNWYWHSPDAENLQGQIKQYAKTLKLYEMHCFDGLFWTQIQFSREGYDKPAKVFRGSYENGVLALVTSYLVTWLEKEFEVTKVPNARILAQGRLYSTKGPVLVLMQKDLGWYYSRTGEKVKAEHEPWIYL